jgi:hypothetical protein
MIYKNFRVTQLLIVTFAYMTTNEVFEKITSEFKWYEPHFSRQHACVLKKRFAENGITQKKMQEIFKRFGYELTENWVKVENK